MQKQILKTGLSAAFWCDPTGGTYTYKPAHLPTGDAKPGDKEQTAWFDELFQGGLEVPAKGSGEAFTLLVTGRPGTGKSTLCLELCYRLAISPQGLRSLYITTEGHVLWLIDHAREFGWDKDPPSYVLGTSPDSLVSIQAAKTAKDRAELYAALSRGSAGAMPSFKAVLEGIKATAAAGHNAVFGIDEPPVDPPPATKPIVMSGLPLVLADFDVLVFDNLNTAVEIDKGDWFELLKECGRSGPRLVIVVLDAPHSQDGLAASWEYLADITISMASDYREPGGYLIRTIEIVKSRYQQAALGRHQVKITKASTQSVRAKDPDGWLRMRDHPYRTQGGIFIYPSMHFVLSRHKHLHRNENVDAGKGRVLPAFAGLQTLLPRGFQAGRCIALTGGRGTHKSRLAYVQMLYTLVNDANARAIVISLGDDEGASRENLIEIAAGQFRTLRIPELEATGRLELSYFPPGFITPEEFFHRLQLSLARNRHLSPRAPLIVVFDSLSLLSSHFPLCAQHKVFIPAVIELLEHEGVTSFFVSASGASEEENALLSLADPILHFSRVSLKVRDFVRRIPPKYRQISPPRLAEASLVKMEVVRFAGGTSAGDHGYLALFSRDDELIKDLPPGLYFSRTKGTFESVVETS